MARSKTAKPSAALTEASANDKTNGDKTVNEKRRELLETRIRWKIADETVKRAMEERLQLRARIEALSAELSAAPETPLA